VQGCFGTPEFKIPDERLVSRRIEGESSDKKGVIGEIKRKLKSGGAWEKELSEPKKISFFVSEEWLEEESYKALIDLNR